MKLFDMPGPNAEPAYKNVYCAHRPETRKIKDFCERLWVDYRPHADQHFRTEIQLNFHARFWEMYLTCTLLAYWPDIVCPKPGPDIKIQTREYSVWIEAVVPNPGDPNKLDSLQKPLPNEVYSVPDEKILLRFRGAIEEKYNKYKSYLANGVVAPADPYVIAMNSAAIPHPGDLPWPRVLGALYEVGPLEVVINTRTMKVVETQHQHRQELIKKSGNAVSASIFLDPFYDGITGLLFSNVNAHSAAILYEQTNRLGSDLIYIQNHVATSLLPQCFFPVSKEFWLEDTNTAFEIRSRDCHVN